MITSLQKDIKKKRSNILETHLDKYLVDKNQITENPKNVWFKGCRHR